MLTRVSSATRLALHNNQRQQQQQQQQQSEPQLQKLPDWPADPEPLTPYVAEGPKSLTRTNQQHPNPEAENPEPQ